MFCIIIAAVDSKESMQAESMCVALHRTQGVVEGNHKVELFSADKLCAYDGIICSAGIITKIDLSSRPELGNVIIPYLPHSLQFLSLERCGQAYTIETRMLPRESRVIELAENLIYGSLEFRTLPPSLVFLSVHSNQLSGTLMLTNLPRTMEAIFGWGNKFSAKYAYCANLPPSLRTVDVSNALLKTKPALKALLADERIDFEKYALGGWKLDVKYVSDSYYREVYAE